MPLTIRGYVPPYLDWKYDRLPGPIPVHPNMVLGRGHWSWPLILALRMVYHEMIPRYMRMSGPLGRELLSDNPASYAVVPVDIRDGLGDDTLAQVAERAGVSVAFARRSLYPRMGRVQGLVSTGLVPWAQDTYRLAKQLGYAIGRGWLHYSRIRAADGTYLHVYVPTLQVDLETAYYIRPSYLVWAARVGGRPTHAVLLSVLARLGVNGNEVSMDDVEAAMGMERPSTYMALRELEAMGAVYVERVAPRHIRAIMRGDEIQRQMV